MGTGTLLKIWSEPADRAGGGQTAALQLDLHSNCVIKTDFENTTDDKTDIFNGMGHLTSSPPQQIRRGIKELERTQLFFSILLGVWSQ